ALHWYSFAWLATLRRSVEPRRFYEASLTNFVIMTMQANVLPTTAVNVDGLDHLAAANDVDTRLGGRLVTGNADVGRIAADAHARPAHHRPRVKLALRRHRL